MSNDANIGISIIMKVIDQGTAIMSQISAGLDKIGLSAQQAGQSLIRPASKRRARSVRLLTGLTISQKALLVVLMLCPQR